MSVLRTHRFSACKYATVRSYHHKNRKPKKILVQAAREGNIQAVVNGLKMYTELRVDKVYLEAAAVATFEGHAEILELFLNLGLVNYKRLSLAAARGGHLALIKRLRELDDTKPCPRMFCDAASGSHVEVLDYLLSLTDLPDLKVLTSISFGSGESGSMEMVKYCIEKGGHTGPSLLGAARAGHLELVKKLAPEADPLAHHEVMSEAVRGGHLDVVKYFVEELQQTHVAPSRIKEAARSAKVDIFFYFVGKGVDTTGQDLLLAAAAGSDLQIMEFLLQQPRTRDELVAAAKIVSRHPWRYLRGKKEVVHLLARQLQVQVQGQRPEELQETILKPFLDGLHEDNLHVVQNLAPYISTEELNSVLQAEVKDGRVKDYLISLLESRKDL